MNPICLTAENHVLHFFVALPGKYIFHERTDRIVKTKGNWRGAGKKDSTEFISNCGGRKN